MNDFSFLDTNSKPEGFDSIRKMTYKFLSFFQRCCYECSIIYKKMIINNAGSQKCLCFKPLVVEKIVTCAKLELDTCVNITKYMI